MSKRKANNDQIALPARKSQRIQNQQQAQHEEEQRLFQQRAQAAENSENAQEEDESDNDRRQNEAEDQQQQQQNQQQQQQNQQQQQQHQQNQEEEDERIPRYAPQHGQQYYQQAQFGQQQHQQQNQYMSGNMGGGMMQRGPIKPGQNILNRLANGHYGFIREQVEAARCYKAYKLIAAPYRAAVDFSRYGVQLMCVYELIHARAQFLGLDPQTGFLQEILAMLDWVSASWTICDQPRQMASIMRMVAASTQSQGGQTLSDQLANLGINGIMAGNMYSAMNHSAMNQRQEKEEICRQYARNGECKFGSKCKYKHVKKQEPTEQKEE
eukprot:CAMPEP_0202713606 /NCGR_PEP_ID=MMETSP1385-20130828/56822_1 /ASSEMBLY_ACC=CAM_ASM_000861 /TAXON_ID=933848 /ORGANISM="Elphidium margaritaceum" /LENGTH=324 /DNA_ID=CAMNT_0049374015 /DNA_START=89 /DNA_END=1063 /DNA_ORIENTATION=+